MLKGKNELPVKDIYEDRVPLSKCRKILKAKENGYTDEDVLLIRDFLYSLAVVDYYVNAQRCKTETIVNEQNINEYDDTKESYSLLPGEYRRAS